MSKAKMIIVDVSRCLSCHSCEMACAVEHSASRKLEEALREEDAPVSRVHVGAVGTSGLPLQCRQCEDAPCVAVCPTGGLHREDENSPVCTNDDVCIGCRLCVIACPFGVITMDKSGKRAIKCDQCIERVQEGGVPACVAACPTHALQFITLDELVEKKRKGYLVQIEKSLAGDEG